MKLQTVMCILVAAASSACTPNVATPNVAVRFTVEQTIPLADTDGMLRSAIEMPLPVSDRVLVSLAGCALSQVVVASGPAAQADF